MIHPDTEVKFISSEVGYGLVAKKFIPMGTITWVMDKFDQVIPQKIFHSLETKYKEILDTYAFRDYKGNHILCWDNARYVNHSFKANCLSTAYDFELAIRDIYPGEELTDDYGYLNINEPFRGRDEGTKRKIVYPDDVVKYYKIWDKKLAKAFIKISKVNQPLRYMISPGKWSEINQIEKGQKEMDSILRCYFKS
ncbi:SET domain-containing protein [Flagellimonas sp. 389]|uniref:SET domain-containing protein n=1 Tax=Flagellimonas sp. 389 TaxID=2835862 RepID=UPI001BD24002|nr:SET domain-containing protein [Flagellimonas sp. 389]MBS9464042.1 SET domain-containing protein [Flagellimonas sp. 389]